MTPTPPIVLACMTCGQLPGAQCVDISTQAPRRLAHLSRRHAADALDAETLRAMARGHRRMARTTSRPARAAELRNLGRVCDRAADDLAAPFDAPSTPLLQLPPWPEMPAHPDDHLF